METPTKSQLAIMSAVGNGSVAMTELARRLGCSLSLLNYHLKSMGDFVVVVRRGRRKIVSLKSPKIRSSNIEIRICP